jgi:DNA-binding NtrC family response regulator
VNSVLQVEFSPSILAEREAILRRNGYSVISILGSSNARSLDLPSAGIGVVVIGHGAPRLERESLISYFRALQPGIPVVALLRSTDTPFADADSNCPADNPPLWERTVIQALMKTERLH